MRLSPKTPNATKVATAITQGSTVRIVVSVGADGPITCEMKSKSSLSAVDAHINAGGSVSIESDDGFSTVTFEPVPAKVEAEVAPAIAEA